MKHEDAREMAQNAAIQDVVRFGTLIVWDQSRRRQENLPVFSWRDVSVAAGRGRHEQPPNY